MPPFVDLAGRVFGRLTVVGISHRTYRIYWACRCACGQTLAVAGISLRGGRTKSCGCWRDEQAGDAQRTHGRSGTHAYKRWLNLIQRCTNPRNKAWASYGGRGIVVCARWRASFESFVADMGEPPTSRHTIDRINNDGPYAPENCRWATNREQTRNFRRNRLLTYDGRTLTLGEWAEATGITRMTIASRLDRDGWTVERALTTHPHQDT